MAARHATLVADGPYRAGQSGQGCEGRPAAAERPTPMGSIKNRGVKRRDHRSSERWAGVRGRRLDVQSSMPAPLTPRILMLPGMVEQCVCAVDDDCGFRRGGGSSAKADRGRRVWRRRSEAGRGRWFLGCDGMGSAAKGGGSWGLGGRVDCVVRVARGIFAMAAGQLFGADTMNAPWGLESRATAYKFIVPSIAYVGRCRSEPLGFASSCN